MARKPSDIRDRLLKAALKRFLREGVDGASLRQIASDAKTNIGMFYYYFKAKEDLFIAVVNEAYERLLADISVALTTDAPIAHRIRTLYTRLGKLSEHETAIVSLVLREMLTSTRRRKRLLGRFQEGHLQLLIRTAHEGIREGVFDPTLNPLMIAATIGVTGGPLQFVRKALAQAFPDSEKETNMNESLVKILLNGVGNGVVEID